MANDVATKKDKEVDLRKEAMHFSMRMPSSTILTAEDHVRNAQAILIYLKGTA